MDVSDWLCIKQSRGSGRRFAGPKRRPSPNPAWPVYEISTWWGILAPAGVPGAIVKKLNSEISGIVSQPDSVQRLEAEGAAPWPLSSADFGRVIASELEKWQRVARESGIRAE